jgi:hypothetical protein
MPNLRVGLKDEDKLRQPFLPHRSSNAVGCHGACTDNDPHFIFHREG